MNERSAMSLSSARTGAGTPARSGRITAVTSGAGGTGKTFLCANLAAALAARGERVLLLDADLGLANLEVVLQLHPRCTLHDVFTIGAALDEAIIAAPGGYSVLFAGSGLVEDSRVASDLRVQLEKVIATLAPQYDRVLIDTGAGISDVVLYAISLAEEVLVLVTPEPTSMTEAYATIKMLATAQRRRTIRLVVNQVSEPGEGRSVCTQLQLVADRFVVPQIDALDAPLLLDLLGEIPIDPQVRETTQKRQLMFDATPACPAARSLAGIAERLGG